MKIPDRDLLVLMKDEFATAQFMEQELEQLNRLLLQHETLDNFCIAHEVFDLNRYRIIHKQKLIRRITFQQQLRPFQFLCNKN